jgi:signal peptidase I
MRLRTIVLLGVIAVLVIVAAPTSWGGSVNYMRIRGTSMEPTIKAGDLVMVRRQDRYDIGDVVAYRSDMGGAVVLHRIVATVGDGYLLQGDNNTFVDRSQPTAGDVLGREVLVIPHGERFVAVMAAPWMLILLSIGTSALWVQRFVARRRPRLGRRRAGSFG